jgi:hypothetical protein
MSSPLQQDPLSSMNEPPVSSEDEHQQQSQQDGQVIQQQHVEWETGYDSVGENMSSTVSSASPATTAQRRMPSLRVSEASNPLLIDSISEMTTPTLPLPHRVEPTLKEKLLERERQRRVETERARWKRQFALNNGSVEDDGGEELTFLRENGSVVGTVGEESSVAHNDLLEEDDEEGEDGAEPMADGKLNNSNNTNNLGYTMERFLSNATGGGVVVVDTSSTQPTGNLSDSTTAGAPNPAPPDKGVVMERFLAEQMAIQQQQQQLPPAMIPPITDGDTVVPHVGPTVSFDALEPTASAVDLGLATSSVPDDEEALEGGPLERASSTSFRMGTPSSSMNMHSSLANLSVIVNASMDDLGHTSLQSIPSYDALEEPDSPISQLGRAQSIGNMSTSSQTASIEQHPPRVLRLTAAEIQELTAIEEASIGNAPPSDRDDESDDSLVGELVGGARFDLTHGGIGVDPTATFSQGTQTTAMESVSIRSDVVLAMGTNSSSAAPTGPHPSGSDSRLVHPHHQHPGVVSDQLVVDHHSLDGIAAGSSVSSRIALSPGASSDDQQGSVSVTANPPSDSGDAEPRSTLIQDVVNEEQHMILHQSDFNTLTAASIEPFARQGGRTQLDHRIDGDEDSLDVPMTAAALGTSSIVNRKIRPGVFANWTPPRQTSHKSPRFSGQSNHKGDDISSLKRSSSLPNARQLIVEGFDFDKNDPTRSPALILGEDSMRDLPGDDIWSSPIGKFNASPFPLMRRHNEVDEEEVDDVLHPFYSSTAAMYGSTTVMSLPLPPPSNDYSLPSLTTSIVQTTSVRSVRTGSNQLLSDEAGETQPLLREIPSGMSANVNGQDETGDYNSKNLQQTQLSSHASLGTVVSEAFREFQSDSPGTIAAVDAESAKYLQNGIIARGK